LGAQAAGRIHLQKILQRISLLSIRDDARITLKIGFCRRWPLVCRNIKTLFNFEPPASNEEIRAASLQFVRKLSGFNSPSKANSAAFDHAIEQITVAAQTLISALVTTADPRDREVEAARARARTAARFGPA
jgi:hypothetical protein